MNKKIICATVVLSILLISFFLIVNAKQNKQVQSVVGNTKTDSIKKEMGDTLIPQGHTTIDSLQGTWYNNADSTNNTQMMFSGRTFYSVDITPDTIYRDTAQLYISNIPYDGNANEADTSMLNYGNFNGKYIILVKRNNLPIPSIDCYEIENLNGHGITNDLELFSLCGGCSTPHSAWHK